MLFYCSPKKKKKKIVASYIFIIIYNIFLLYITYSATNRIFLIIQWETGHSCYPAIIISVARHLDVTFVTPILSVRILEQPVILSVFSSIAYGQHGVVESIFRIVSTIGTFFVIIYPTLVEIETVVAGVEANGNWTDGSDGCL